MRAQTLAVLYLRRVALTLSFILAISCEGSSGNGSNSGIIEDDPTPIISEAAVCTAEGDQYSPEAVSDGSGGVIIAWIDERADDLFYIKVYSQRINAASENGLWDNDGIPMSTVFGGQVGQQVVHNGSDAALYVWQEMRGVGGNAVHAQKLEVTSGSAQWATDSVQVVSGLVNAAIHAVPDGFGGVVFAFTRYPPMPGNSSIAAQRLAGSTGASQWSTDQGVEVCAAVNNPVHPRVAPDGSGGVVVTWDDARSGDNDIYVQRSDAATGAPQWTINGIAVSAASGIQEFPMIVADGAGGVIIAWQDFRSGDADIYAQRIDIASGTPQWTANGVPVCVADGEQISPMIIADGSGGAVITWQDGRSGDNDIYAQRVVMASGAAAWTTNGVPVSTAGMGQDSPRIILDGLGNVIISWEDFRSETEGDLYAQKVDLATGKAQWENDGIAVSVWPGAQSEHRIVPNGSGGAIIIWTESGGDDKDIYAQEVRSDGTI